MKAVEAIVDLIELGAVAPNDIVKCLRSALAASEWQGLTDEEIMNITGVTSADSDWNVVIVHKWIRAIEAKLKEKNSG